MPHFVAVLDGASGTSDGHRDGGWYADQLGAALKTHVTEDVDLRDALASSIAEVAKVHDLQPGTSPSSTVAMVRWAGEQVDALVLGDSPVVAFTRAGDVEVLRDDRLADVAPDLRAGYKAALAEGHGYGPEHNVRLRQLVSVQLSYRNKSGGYWIAEADPTAAGHARVAAWEAAHLEALLLVTDGVSAGVDLYDRPGSWGHARRLVEVAGPEALIDLTAACEEDDPEGRKWPRSKRQDDKALVYIATRLRADRDRY